MREKYRCVGCWCKETVRPLNEFAEWKMHAVFCVFLDDKNIKLRLTCKLYLANGET
jgi:hypothetical protein